MARSKKRPCINAQGEREVLHWHLPPTPQDHAFEAVVDALNLRRKPAGDPKTASETLYESGDTLLGYPDAQDPRRMRIAALIEAVASCSVNGTVLSPISINRLSDMGRLKESPTFIHDFTYSTLALRKKLLKEVQFDSADDFFVHALDEFNNSDGNVDMGEVKMAMNNQGDAYNRRAEAAAIKLIPQE